MRALIFLSIAAAFACARSERAAAPKTTTYRATITHAELGEVPLYLELPGAAGTARFLNGAHVLEAPVTWAGAKATIELSVYEARIVAERDASGALAGEFVVDSPLTGTRQPFRAVPVAAAAPQERFPPAVLAGTAVDLGEARTIWKVAFSEAGVAKLRLIQREPGAFDASFTFASGNYVYLAGNGRGGKLRFSGFDGLSSFLVELDLDAAGKKATGRWSAGPDLSWRETFEAERQTGDFVMTPPVEPPPGGGAFSMKQLDEYKGRPVIVELAGSWCTACGYAASALKPIYQRLHGKGLEVVTLAYEFTDDAAHNARQAALFKKTYDLPWEVIPVDGEPERFRETAPAVVADVGSLAFPIAIFVKKDSTVHSVQSSFPGPEFEEEHEHKVQTYQRLAEEITE